MKKFRIFRTFDSGLNVETNQSLGTLEVSARRFKEISFQCEGNDQPINLVFTEREMIELKVKNPNNSITHLPAFFESDLVSIEEVK